MFRVRTDTERAFIALGPVAEVLVVDGDAARWLQLVARDFPPRSSAPKLATTPFLRQLMQSLRTTAGTAPSSSKHSASSVSVVSRVSLMAKRTKR